MTFRVGLVGRGDLNGEIYRQIKQAILGGRLLPGEQLSPTRELAAALAASRSTVTVAYERLFAEGLPRQLDLQPLSTRLASISASLAFV